MGRKAVGPRYWNRKGGGYFCVFQGTEHELALGPKDEPSGPTYLAALDAFKKVMEGGTPEPPKSASPTVREVLDAYLKHISKTKKLGTVEIRLRSFVPFVNHPAKGGLLVEREVSSLTHQTVYDFLKHMETVPRTQVR